MIADAGQQVDQTEDALNRQFNFYLNMKKQQTSQLISSLDLLSPLGTLARGYSFTSKEDKIIKSVHELKVHELIDIQLYDGQVQAEVQTITKQDKGE